MLETIALGKQLTKEQMREVKGGDHGCCVHNADWSIAGCGHSKASAMERADTIAEIFGERTFWCCASC